MDNTIAAIRSILAAPPPPGAAAPVKDAKIKILKLLQHWPQPTLRAIAGRIRLSERAAKMHLQTLFRAGMIRKRAFYELTRAGRARVNYENELAGRASVCARREAWRAQ
jgi:predicted ArsR family transcriptional regulator